MLQIKVTSGDRLEVSTLPDTNHGMLIALDNRVFKSLWTALPLKWACHTCIFP
jgi:hypothetical protein